MKSICKMFIPAMLYHDIVKYLAILSLLLVPISVCYAQSASPGSVLTFTITDENLVTDHRGVMTLSTSGLVDFTIDGTPIPGPSSMVETGIDTGVFQLQLTLPSSVNGRPLQNGDVVLMTYHQPADYAGNPETITQSVVLSSQPTVPVEPTGSSQQSVNIGQYFTIQLYAPNYNLDSQVPDDIPLSLVQVHMGGVSTTLADNAFDIGTGSLRETGPNTNTFAATFKIPTQIDGFPVEIGSTLEFTVGDNSQPIPSESSIFVTIGTHYQPVTSAAAQVPVAHDITVQTTSTTSTSVNFLNSTVLQGLANPVCYPSSGTLFPIGTTTVTCSAINQEGNSVLKSFSVIVNHENTPIPFWVKNLAGLWCNGSIQDSDFAAAIKFLDSSKIISIPTPQNPASSIDKSDICSWSEGKITDDSVIPLFYPLIR
ncbi:MAG: hypothetical protein ACREBB_08685 [Nitrosotalea sp.]